MSVCYDKIVNKIYDDNKMMYYVCNMQWITKSHVIYTHRTLILILVCKNYNLRVVLGTSEGPLKTNSYKTKQQLEGCVRAVAKHTAHLPWLTSCIIQYRNTTVRDFFWTASIKH